MLRESRDILSAALQDKDANVRHTALLCDVPVSQETRSLVEAALSDSSYLNVELALQTLCRSFPSDIPYYLEKTKNEKGWRGLNIRITWLEIAIGNGEEQYSPELIAYSGPGFEFETRMNALAALKNLDIFDSTVIRNAVTAALHWNFKLAGAGKDVLVYFSNLPASRDMTQAVIKSMELDPKEQEKIEQMIKPTVK